MHVRLSAAWVDPGGAVYAAGDVVDVDAVTLANLEEQGMVEELDGQTTGSEGGTGATTTEPAPPGTKDPSKVIGPGPGAPPKDDNGGTD